MVEWGRGAKAGLVAGGTWGIITAVETAVTSSPVGIVLIFVILRIAWGLLLGIVFAAIADRFMSASHRFWLHPLFYRFFLLGLVFAAIAERFNSARTYRVKGFLYGLILGIIELALNLGALAVGATNFDVSVGVSLGVGLVSASVVGYVLGFSYEKFGPIAHS